MRKATILFCMLIGVPMLAQADCLNYTVFPTIPAYGRFTEGIVGKIETSSDLQGDPQYTIYLDSYLDSNQEPETCRLFRISDSNDSLSPSLESRKSAQKIALTAYTLNYFLEGRINTTWSSFRNTSNLSLKRRP